MSYDSAKVPQLFKGVQWRSYSVNLDMWGAASEDVTLYLAEQGVDNVVYDPVERSAEHNEYAIKFIMRIGGAHSVTLSNVLSVIPSIKDRDAILYYSKFLSKLYSPVYIGVYEGDNLQDYKEEVSKRFRVISITNDMITAVNEDR